MDTSQRNRIYNHVGVLFFFVVVVVFFWGGGVVLFSFFFFFFPFGVPQLYLWGSPRLGEIFAYVTVFFKIQPLR